MRVFVAGGSGALGRRVVRRLVESGHGARATARGAAAADTVRAGGGEPVQIDVFDAAAVRGALDGCDAVLRLTTKIPPMLHMRSARAWRETGRLRNEGARLLVDACLDAGIDTYLHESVTFVYADGGDAWLDEDAALDVAPTPLRDAASGEAHATRFAGAGGRGIVLRFAGFYAADTTQTLAMAEMARQRRVALIGPSQNYFSAIHVDDAAAAVVAALDAPAGVYNIADGEPLRLAEFMGCLAGAARAPALRRIPAIAGPVVLGETWRYLRRSQRVSAERFRTITGWAPEYRDARSGFRSIAAQWAAGVTVSQGSPA